MSVAPGIRSRPLPPVGISVPALALLLALGCSAETGTAVTPDATARADAKVSTQDVTLALQDAPAQEYDAGISPRLDSGRKTDLPANAPCAAGMPWLDLPVRVSYLQSSAVPMLNAAVDPGQLAQAFVALNALWQQACIRFQVESTQEITSIPQYEPAFLASYNANEKQPLATALLQLIPTQGLLRPGWNVVFVRQFSKSSPGRNFAKLGGPVVAQFRGDDKTWVPFSILAHELGHSLLTGSHHPGTNNLMKAGGGGEPGTDLDAQQIASARTQAATGDAHRGSF